MIRRGDLGLNHFLHERYLNQNIRRPILSWEMVLLASESASPGPALANEEPLPPCWPGRGRGRAAERRCISLHNLLLPFPFNQGGVQYQEHRERLPEYRYQFRTLYGKQSDSAQRAGCVSRYRTDRGKGDRFSGIS